MKKFISFSGGVESTTMLVLYGDGAKAIFSDGGSEHKKMYARLDFVETEIKKIYPEFEIIRIIPSVTCKGEKMNTIEDYAIASKFMPSGQARYCTSEFKIKPIDKFLKEQGECELMIGLNYDEDPGNIRTGNYMMCKNVKYTYPLHEDGYTRKDCELILTKLGLHPNMPAYMSRGGCRMCFFKTKKEYEAMYWLSRDEFNEVLAFEEKIQDARKKFYSIMQNGMSLRQLRDKLETSLFSSEDAYDIKDKNETSCGLFCHR
jgi:3'-phosphoadenosine 5'-phosphosulfate sulfotransferase (PAPS reductase)/FAD synthetase